VTQARDPRFLLRAAALLLLLAAMLAPDVTARRAAYDALAVLDITGSMNVRDAAADGGTTTRIAAERLAVRRLLAGLPCGSRLGLAVFVERQPFLLFEPVETCGDFAVLDAEIDAVDWRMGWDSESHIAEALAASLRLARGLGADLVFMTDGQETPPLAGNAAPDFVATRGQLRGLIEGVGGRIPVPIPKFDTYGRQIGVFKPGEVPGERQGVFTGSEHLSAVDEPHLRDLADRTGLAYRHLDDPDDLAGQFRAVARARVLAGRARTGWVAASLALLLLLLSALPGDRQGLAQSLGQLGQIARRRTHQV
jgi:mxaL protein